MIDAVPCFVIVPYTIRKPWVHTNTYTHTLMQARVHFASWETFNKLGIVGEKEEKLHASYPG